VCFPAEGWRRAEDPGQSWTSTLPTLHLLHDFGVELVNRGSRR